MRKEIIFNLVILIFIFGVCEKLISGGYYPDSEKIDVRFSGEFKINKVIELIATIIPPEDSEELFTAYISGGGENSIQTIDWFKGAPELFPWAINIDKTCKLTGEDSGPFWWYGKIKKDNPIHIKGKIKVVRPGVWRLGVNLHVGDSREEEYLRHVMMGKEVYIIADGGGNITFSYEKPKENNIVSYLELRIEDNKIPLNIIPHKIKAVGFNSDYIPTVSWTHGPDVCVPLDTSKLKWEVIGGIGEIDENGNFTGTKLGKGKVVATYMEYVKGEIEIEVVKDIKTPP